MEFLREEDTESAETSKDIAVIDSGGKKGSNPGDSAVELEKSEAWPDHHSRAKKETRGKRLNWLKVIGKHRNG